MDLEHQVQQIMGKDRRSASLTSYKNRGQIQRFCRSVEEKYGLCNIRHLKTKHIFGVLFDMKASGRSATTIASYATAARQIASAIGKQNIVPKTNAELGISRAGERLKPVAADTAKIVEITQALHQKGEWLGLAAELRSQFGLRAKESLMSNEVREGCLVIRGAKGGRPRSIEIRTSEQAALVEQVQVHIQERGQTSLIPQGMSLKQGYKAQANALHRLGATKAVSAHAHASRHKYAQDRAAQGASKLDVSAELGHGREDVVSHYVK